MRKTGSGAPASVWGFWGLAVGAVCGAVGAALMRRGSFGLTPFYSVPLALLEATGRFTMGAWNAAFQAALVLILILLVGPAPRHGLSFVVAAAASVVLDGANRLCAFLPATLFWRVGCYLAGFLIMGFGIALLAECKMPVAPMNLFVRELAEHYGRPFKDVKLRFDVGCLLFSLAVSLLVRHWLSGVGAGTLASAVLMGPLTGAYIRLLRRYIVFHK